MPTLVFDPQPSVIEALINRIPDLVLQRPRDARPQWQQTAALAVEIRSPGDDTDKKLGFYGAHDVDELLIVDPDQRSVEWLGLAGGEYRSLERSALIDLGPAELGERIEWPAPGD